MLQNPLALGTSLQMAIAFQLVLFIIAWIQATVGNPGVLASAALLGLTDMDAITLSTAELMNTDSLDLLVGWRVILIAALANLAFKGGIVAVLGGKTLFKRIALVYGISLIAGLAILFFWPA